MKQITFNPNNESYYSEDFIKGFECGAQRQFEADKANKPQTDCTTCEHYNDVGDWCKTCGMSHYTPRMKGADDDEI